MIRPYLRELIDEHKPAVKLKINNNNDNNNNNNNNNINNNNSNSSNSNNSNNSNSSNSSNNNRAEWKIQLTMQNNCISTKRFEETHTIHTKSEPLEIFMGSDTEDVIDKHFNTIDIRRAESYIITPDWIASKKATINPKNEKDNKCFQWLIISVLNYNKINEKYLKKIEKLKRVDIDLLSHERDWEKFEQENNSVALNVLFVSCNSEEIKRAYKSNYNKRKKSSNFVSD